MKLNFKMFTTGGFIGLILVILALNIPSVFAWHSQESAQSRCDGNNVVIDYSFTNTDTQNMIVKVKDEQTGKIVDRTAAVGQTITGTIDRGQSSIVDGEIHFILYWAKGGSENDIIPVKYSAVSCNSTEPTPTPTGTPSTTPTPTNTPSSGGSDGGSSNPGATQPFVCTVGDLNEAPANAFVVRKGTDATVNFFINKDDSANIYWSVVGQPHWGNSSAGTNPDGVKPNDLGFVSYPIHNLDASQGYDFGIQPKKGCGGGKITTVIVDGPQAKTFRVSYYELSK